MKKNITTTTLQLGKKVAPKPKLTTPVHRAYKNCETLHLHDRSPLVVHLRDVFFSVFFSEKKHDKWEKVHPHMQLLPLVALCTLLSSHRFNQSFDPHAVIMAWDELCKASTCPNTNLPILLDATLHKLSAGNYPLNPGNLSAILLGPPLPVKHLS